MIGIEKKISSYSEFLESVKKDMTEEQEIHICHDYFDDSFEMKKNVLEADNLIKYCVHPAVDLQNIALTLTEDAQNNNKTVIIRFHYIESLDLLDGHIEIYKNIEQKQ